MGDVLIISNVHMMGDNKKNIGDQAVKYRCQPGQVCCILIRCIVMLSTGSREQVGV